MKKNAENIAFKVLAWLIVTFGSVAFFALCVGIIRWGLGL